MGMGVWGDCRGARGVWWRADSGAAALVTSKCAGTVCSPGTQEWPSSSLNIHPPPCQEEKKKSGGLNPSLFVCFVFFFHLTPRPSSTLSGRFSSFIFFLIFSELFFLSELLPPRGAAAQTRRASTPSSASGSAGRRRESPPADLRALWVVAGESGPDISQQQQQH